MKLLLINPKDKTTSAHSNHFPPLSIGYLAALTPPNWEIKFIDENFDEFFPHKADLVGITAMTIQINRAFEIALQYKNMGVPVVIGGIHASMRPDEALRYASSVVVGEAEGLWQRALRDFLEGGLRERYQSDSHPSLQNTVLPRRDLFSRKYLFDCIQTSRGCPFHCDFCSVPSLNGRAYRLRPIEDVIKELKTIKKKFVFFVDDNVVGYGKENEERAVALFEAILKNGIRKYWISQASTNIAGNERLLSLMKKSGCLGLLIGFESIDAENLRRCGKTQNLSRNSSPERSYRAIIGSLHKHGIAANGYFCFGIEDTPETIARTTDFILGSRVDIVNTPIIVPTPGTPLFEELYHRLEFKNYPKDWKMYLGRLVYSPHRSSKKEFYKAYLLSSRKIASLKEIVRRAFYSLTWSNDPVQALMILLFNLGYRNLREKGLSVLRSEDPDFQEAYEDLMRKGPPSRKRSPP